MRRQDWLMVICGFTILTVGMGARQSFGIFQKPIAADLQVGREVWSFANAASMLLMGAVAPFVGGFADRFGTARMVLGGSLVCVAGTLITAMASNGSVLIVGVVISGLGIAAAGLGPILGAINRNVPASHRSLALGIVTAGSSFGQFAIVPTVSLIQDMWLKDWHASMMALALVSALVLPLALGLREPARPVARPGAAAPQNWRQALGEAFAHRGFLLLTLGFFVCGFHVAFVGLHLPAYISDKAVSASLFGIHISPDALGGWAVGLVGLFNMAGTILWGWLGGRHQRKNMLCLLYALRSLVFILFLVVPLSPFSVLAFGAALGFLWLGTIPLTSGLVGYFFGPAYVSMLFGIPFLSHQVGSFFGSWGGGLLFDRFGNYDAMWWISVALGLGAAACNWPIREQPAARLAPQPA